MGGLRHRLTAAQPVPVQGAAGVTGEGRVALSSAVSVELWEEALQDDKDLLIDAGDDL